MIIDNFYWCVFFRWMSVGKTLKYPYLPSRPRSLRPQQVKLCTPSLLWSQRSLFCTSVFLFVCTLYIWRVKHSLNLIKCYISLHRGYLYFCCKIQELCCTRLQGISVLICTSKEYCAVYLCGGEDIASKERIGDAEHHLGLPATMSTDKTEGGTYESSK